MKLTDKTCKNAKPGEKTRRLFDGGGLYLEITPSNRRYWRFKYRFGGKEKRLAFGVYPDVSLSEARSAREAARKQIRKGIDPSEVKRTERRRQTIDGENTFKAIANEWYEHKKSGWSPNHAQTVKRRLDAEIYSLFGTTPISGITTPDIVQLVRRIEKREAYEVARRCLQLCGQVFRYAVVTGRVVNNPATDLRGVLKPVKRGHYAALEAKELPEFLEKFHSNDARLFPITRYAVELLLNTFVRTSELIQAEWCEFDIPENTWLIPAERMKMRQAHVVPLSKQVVAILEKLQLLSGNRDYIFPSQRDPRKHMSNNAVLTALGRMGYRGRATGHGFRALAMSTIKEKLGYRHEVVDRQLAHAHRNAVDAAYDRAKFLDERRVMMQEWSDYLDQVQTKATIIPLRKEIS